MLDGDDVEDVVLVGLMSNMGCFGWTILLGIIGIMLYVVSDNREDCSRLHCTGASVPKLMNNDCLCVEKAR